ncbi:hypothetical protein [uncultured Pseudomonas sp.]|uniref:hypothetical protein n=1 Tax=uncultured Pseudomonas sp. TaxID=114707 RepID=UPI00258D9D80|nr:hypothetical protein [uncultured Pseudomonas sp.]
MKKISVMAFVFFVVSGEIGAEGFDCGRVLMVGTGYVDGKIFRYVTTSQDACLTIQNLVPGGGGKVAAESRICDLNGKSFNSDFVDVDFKRGYFTDKGLFFEVGITPLRPIGEKVVCCEVKFAQGVADHLSCEGELLD